MDGTRRNRWAVALLGTSQTGCESRTLPLRRAQHTQRWQAPILGSGSPWAVSSCDHHKPLCREGPVCMPLAHVPVHLQGKCSEVRLLGQRGQAFAIL